ncbi:MAG: translation initiation factor IF-2, partial [Fimbriimonadaceae bacterium]
MATKATKENDVLTVKDLAQEYDVAPGEVNRVLRELEIEPENGEIQADNELLELAREELESLRGQKTVQLPPNATPRDIAAALGIPDKQVQKTLIQKMKIMATLTKSLEQDVAEKLVAEFGYEASFEKPKPKKAKPEPKEVESKGHSRPPVVTILGHVDHGKTSLLDYIRKTKVVAKEHGGITQHIGAYQAELDSGVITFLDTPGHAAFTAMRARGAQVTDIAILVVAADDGIMPQTKEAISHVKAADVPMIVAINKIDKPEANPDRILQQLTEHEVIPEEFGGDVLSARVSAETGEGIPDLLEKVLLQAEVLELKADPQAEFEGIVIESKLEKGRGPVATVLVKSGTLRQGDILVVGKTWGKVKAMTDHLGNRLKEATPAMPVEVLGLNEVPDSGDRVVPAADERSAREVVDERTQQERAKLTSSVRRAQTLRDLKRKLNEGETKDLNLI